MSEGHSHEHPHGNPEGNPEGNPSEAVRQHREAAPETVRVAILTISDTRTPENDTGGDEIRDRIEGAGHEVVARHIVHDEAPYIRQRLVDLFASSEVDAVITTGGTGISGRDTTYEVAERMIEKKLDGFGEIFRMLSYEEVGAAAMLSRAIAGSTGGKLLACLPGSKNAVSLAMEKLLVPEISHIVFELKRHGERQRKEG
jgi:molybdopterin adenylyltransferase